MFLINVWHKYAPKIAVHVHLENHNKMVTALSLQKVNEPSESHKDLKFPKIRIHSFIHFGLFISLSFIFNYEKSVNIYFIS